MTNPHRAAWLLAGALALAAPVSGQGAPAPADPNVGCYSFEGEAEPSGGAITERFRLTAEPSIDPDLPGPWQVVAAVPGEALRTAKASWSVGANTLIRVVWGYEVGRVLLQFEQMEPGRTLPVEGMLAGPGPEPGIAQTAYGFVVRFPC